MENKKPRSRAWTVAGWVFGFVVAFAIVFGLTWKPESRVGAGGDLSPEEVGEVMRRAVAQVNKKGPAYIDEITRFDSAEVRDGGILQYNYTIMLRSSDFELAVFRTDLSKQLFAEVSTEPAMEFYRENGVTFIYSYKDIDKEHMFDIVITPEMYNSFNSASKPGRGSEGDGPSGGQP